jgi:hypothetical protein
MHSIISYCALYCIFDNFLVSGIFLFNVLSNILAPYFSHYNHVRAVGRYEIFVRIQLNEIKLLVLVNLGSFLVLFFFLYQLILQVFMEHLLSICRILDILDLSHPDIAVILKINLSWKE